MVRRTWMLPAVLVMLLAGAARAEPEYVYRKPVKGVALVVGNADYSSQTKLPGSLRDADLVAKELQKLGFEVILRTNLRTREQFIEQALEPFWSKIEPNTIVAFYFSGHGFSFGGESYLAPLDFPNSVPYDKTAETFLSATAILDSIAERRPGVMLMVLDACRNMTTIIDTAGDPSNRAQTKGLTAPAAATAKSLSAGGPANGDVAGDAPIDTLVWFSSAQGSVSYAGPDGTASFYTDALVRHLPTPDQGIDSLRKLVRIDVIDEAAQHGAEQEPWSSESSSAEIWFAPTEQTLAFLQARWRDLVDARLRGPIAKFLRSYGATPFAAAARQWLADHPTAPVVVASSVSPAAPEAVWDIDNRASPAPATASVLSPSGKPIEFSGALAVPRTLDWDDVTARSHTGSRAPAGIDNPLATQGALVAREAIQARRRPDGTGEAVTLPPGTGLRVTPGPLADSKWLGVTATRLGERLYIPLAESAALGVRDIGAPVLQAIAPVPTSGPRGFVDEAFVVKSLEDVKARGKTVSWVSIATPPARDGGERDLLSLRASYAAVLLAKHGVSASQITIVEGAATGEPNVRLRFFGR